MTTIFSKKSISNSVLRGILIGILVVAAAVLGLITWKLYHVKIVSLSEQHLPLETGLVAITTTTSTKPVLSFYRLNDGQEQTFPGTFQYYFLNQQRVLVWGVPANSTSSQYFVVLEPKAAQIKNISSLPGSIVHAIPSSSGHLVLLSGLVNQSKSTTGLKEFYSCVVLVGARDYHGCEFVDKDILRPQLKKTFDPQTIYETAWYPGTDNTLLISERGHKNGLFTYQVMSRTLTDITTSSEQLAGLTGSSTPVRMEKNTILQIGPFAWAKSGARTHGLLLKLGTTVAPLGNDLLLATDTRALWVINLATRTKSIVTTLAPPHQRRVEWHAPNQNK